MTRQATAARRPMAKQSGTATTAQPGVVARIREFFDEVMVEMSKVAWPSKNELRDHTTIVMWTLLVLAVIIGAYDWVFLRVIRLMLLLG
jgi:preprotein translocase subunit SecE